MFLSYNHSNSSLLMNDWTNGISNSIYVTMHYFNMMTATFLVATCMPVLPRLSAMIFSIQNVRAICRSVGSE